MGIENNIFATNNRTGTQLRFRRLDHPITDVLVRTIGTKNGMPNLKPTSSAGKLAFGAMSPSARAYLVQWIIRQNNVSRLLYFQTKDG
jgi:hypothetical protein